MKTVEPFYAKFDPSMHQVKYCLIHPIKIAQIHDGAYNYDKVIKSKQRISRNLISELEQLYWWQQIIFKFWIKEITERLKHVNQLIWVLNWKLIYKICSTVQHGGKFYEMKFTISTFEHLKRQDSEIKLPPAVIDLCAQTARIFGSLKILGQNQEGSPVFPKIKSQLRILCDLAPLPITLLALTASIAHTSWPEVNY